MQTHHQGDLFPPKSAEKQKKAVRGTDLILYMEDGGGQFIKASSIRAMSDEQLSETHSTVLDVLTMLKSRRDMLAKQYRRKEITSTKPILKTKRWMAKAGAMLNLIQSEQSDRKRRYSVSFAQAFVQAAQNQLDPDVFAALIDQAAESASGSSGNLNLSAEM